jgi:hypothetical protein
MAILRRKVKKEGKAGAAEGEPPRRRFLERPGEARWW